MSLKMSLLLSTAGLVILGTVGCTFASAQQDSIQTAQCNPTVTASVDKAQPTQNQVVTVTVAVLNNNLPVADAHVETVWAFSTVESREVGDTDGNGRVRLSHQIGRAKTGYKVVIDVTTKFKNCRAVTQTSFTPRKK